MAADAAAAPAKPGKIATVIQLSIQSIFLSIVYIVFVYAVRLWKGELVNFRVAPLLDCDWDGGTLVCSPLACTGTGRVGCRCRTRSLAPLACVGSVLRVIVTVKGMGRSWSQQGPVSRLTRACVQPGDGCLGC